MLRTKNRVSIVCGLKASGYEDVLQISDGRVRRAIPLIDLTAIDRTIASSKRNSGVTTKQRPEGTTIYTVPDSVPWSEKWIQEALESIRKLQRKDKSVHVLFMADPVHLLQLLSSHDKLDRMGIQWIPLRPWGKGFLRQWMDDVGFVNSPEIRKSVVEQTGGCPILLRRLHNMEKATGNLESALNSLDAESMDTSKNADLQKEFGIDGLDVQTKTLLGLAQLGEEDFSELKAFAEDDGIDGETLRRTLNWAELLHVVRRVGKGRWRMDPVVARLLGSASN